MVRFANERHNIIGNATARLWMFKDVTTAEGQPYRRFFELPLVRNESPALALSWTLHHVLDEASPLRGLNEKTSPPTRFHSLWSCPGMTLLRRKQFMRASLMTIRRFAPDTAMWTCSAPQGMAASESITAGSMTR